MIAGRPRSRWHDQMRVLATAPRELHALCADAGAAHWLAKYHPRSRPVFPHRFQHPPTP